MTRRIDWEQELQDTELEDFLEELPPTEAGNYFHNYLERELSECDSLEVEGEIYEDGELQGRYDLMDIESGVIYEFKTKTERGLEQAPYNEDVRQISRYLEGTDTDVGFLVYVSRSDLEVEEYPVSR